MQCATPGFLKIPPKVLLLPEFTNNFVGIPAGLLRCECVEELAGGFAVVERGDERLLQRYSAVECAGIAPGCQIVRVGEMGGAATGGCSEAEANGHALFYVG